MSRQKTLFKKYMRITSLIVLVSFLFLGLLMIQISSGYWAGEKQETLKKNAQDVSAVASQFITVDTDTGKYEMNPVVKQFMDAFASNMNADIFLADKQGTCLLVAYGSQNDASGEVVFNPGTMEKAMKGGYFGQDKLGDIYRDIHYIVGVPLRAVRSSGQVDVVGAVFMASNAKMLADYRTNMFRMFLLAAIAAFMVTFCAVWLFSYRMVRPLRNMAAAAHSFGEGNFAVRVPVTEDDEIGQLALAFNNMACSLSTGENVRRNFIANVSHELKTPMTTIAGFIDGILDGTIPPDKQEHYLKIVSQEVKRLSRLVRTMLDLSRIDSGELKLRPSRFDLTATILNALLSFEKPIEDKRLEIRGLEDAESLFVDGDPDMIHQVMYNLIENAVKFTNVGGYIEITLEDQSDRDVVRIKNSGQGIPAEEVSLIFDRFYKTDKSRSQDKNGMGLGLYIVRTIIRLHGGEITVSSVENEYCQFQFWLPKKAETQKLNEVTPAPPAR